MTNHILTKQTENLNEKGHVANDIQWSLRTYTGASNVSFIFINCSFHQLMLTNLD